MRIVTGVVIAVACGVLAGCGAGGGAGAEANPCDGGCAPLGAGDEAFLTNFCTLLEGCCITNGVRTMPDVAGCKTQIETNGFSRDPALQSSCLAEMQDRMANGEACFPDTANFADPCLRLYYEPAGFSPPGGACTIRADCAGAPGLITLCLIGFCTQMARGQAGAGPCMGAVDSDGTIVAAPILLSTPPPITTGVVCEVNAGLYCRESDTDKTMQTCQPLGAGNDACDFSLACASGGCLGDNQPDGVLAGTCTPVVSAGQTCGDNATQAVCDDASYCQFPAAGNTGAGGVCVPKLAAGSSCNDDTMCEVGTCSYGNCAAVPGIAVLGYCGR